MNISRKIRTVLVGCGNMSNLWLQSALALPQVEIVGLVDVVEAAARQKAAQFQLTQAVIGTDLEAVLQETKADAVFNCTVPDAHYDVTMLALGHGCHVLSEKPLADSMERAREMVAAAQRARRIFAVIQNRRYDPAIRRMTSFLASSIHSFDAARLLTGADAVSVYCHEWNPRGSWYEHDASAIAIFEMSNGVVYTYRGSWCAEGLSTSWECDWRFIGQRGSVLWDGGERTQIQVVKETGGFISTYDDMSLPTYEASNSGGHAGIIQEFFTCIQNGTQPETRAEDNIKSLAMVFGAIESAEKGQKIRIA